MLGNYHHRENWRRDNIEVISRRWNKREEQTENERLKYNIILLSSNNICPLFVTILVFKGSRGKWFVGLIKPCRE